MSVSTDPIETAATPPRAWQYIFIIITLLLGVFVLWLYLSGVEFWHHTPQKPLQARVDTGSPGQYKGRPDEIERAAMNVQQQRPPPPPPKIDENINFNAPISPTAASAPPPRFAPPPEQPQTQDVAMASSMGGGGSSLLGPPATASRLKNPLLTILKGTNIPCADVTVIDTGAGGNVLVKATISGEVKGGGGKVTLLDKGSELLGEVGHAMVDGLDRIGIVWREVTTPYPNFIRVSLDSPATGPLGEGGLDGDVNRHEWMKIKGVLLFTLIQGASQVLQSALAQHGSTSINFGNVNSSGQEIGSILLSKMLNIPDTIHRDQGLTCSAFLARDLDFSKVYSLNVTR